MAEKVQRYAANTKVSAGKTRTEIEALLKKHGASEIAVHTSGSGARLLYRMRDRMLRQDIPYPKPDAYLLRDPKRPRTSKRAPSEVLVLQEREYRRRWRAALLILKARLEAIASGDADFEAMFLGDILLPSGETMVEAMRPRLAEAYASGEMPSLLLGAGK